jgi:hypothetical protein
MSGYKLKDRGRKLCLFVFWRYLTLFYTKSQSNNPEDGLNFASLACSRNLVFELKVNHSRRTKWSGANCGLFV